MPLSDPKPRKHRHTRRIELNGYERDDGLWDIEAHLTDTKSYDFRNHFRGAIEPGEPIHEMWMRLTVDDALVIHGVEGSTDYSPFPDCPRAAPRYERLVGMRIRPGWTDRVKDRLQTAEGCTHLTELLRPLATTAIQTIMPLRRERYENDPANGKRPRLLDTCHGWRRSGAAVQAIHPDWYEEEA